VEVHADGLKSRSAATLDGQGIDGQGRQLLIGQRNPRRVGRRGVGGLFEAVLRRLSIHMGRVLLTTTPYDLGWIKQKLYDP
jgi:hypothetical protein